jgi:hypothetical protein
MTEPWNAGYAARRRIRELQERPESVDVKLFFDKRRNVWLGELDLTQMEDSDADLNLHVAAEGVTKAEVLRKLSEILK